MPGAIPNHKNRLTEEISQKHKEDFIEKEFEVLEALGFSMEYSLPYKYLK
jgi:hypothetical protein